MYQKRLVATITLISISTAVLFGAAPSKADVNIEQEPVTEITEAFPSDGKLPAAGVAAMMGDGTDYTGLSILSDEDEEASGEVIESEEDPMTPNAVCNVGDYVYLREDLSEYPDTTGILYRNSVAEILSEEGEEAYVRSGNVYGYIRKDFLLSGDEAKEMIDAATVTTAVTDVDNLYVRSNPSNEAAGLMILPRDEEAVVCAIQGDWVQVRLADRIGYIYRPYVKLRTEYLTAMTEVEIDEQQREVLRAEMESRALQNIAYDASNGAPSHFVSKDGGSEEGRAVAEFACRFVGNPYVWGGTSLTDGCDCSGFVMSVYKEFGFELTHSTEIDQTEGMPVTSIEEAEPGDIICYQGHVAIYIGDGMIVHAAGAAKGIVISMACYDNIITIRRMF